MPRRSVRKRASAHANAAKRERRYTSADQPRLKTQVQVRIASRSVVHADLHSYSVTQPLLQVARLSMFSAATLLDYHASDGDGVLDERRFAPLPRAGITNLGKTCFLSSSVQLIARPLFAARSVTAAGTLAARAGDVALYAVLGVHCSSAALQELLTTLPCGFGWRDQRACPCERCCTACTYRPTRAVIAARLLASFSGQRHCSRHTSLRTLATKAARNVDSRAAAARRVAIRQSVRSVSLRLLPRAHPRFAP